MMESNRDDDSGEKGGSGGLSVNMSKSSTIAMVVPPLSIFFFGATVVPRSLRIRTSFTTSLTLR